jgi:hypothetical protein
VLVFICESRKTCCSISVIGWSRQQHNLFSKVVVYPGDIQITKAIKYKCSLVYAILLLFCPVSYVGQGRHWPGHGCLCWCKTQIRRPSIGKQVYKDTGICCWHLFDRRGSSSTDLECRSKPAAWISEKRRDDLLLLRGVVRSCLLKQTVNFWCSAASEKLKD